MSWASSVGALQPRWIAGMPTSAPVVQRRCRVATHEAIFRFHIWAVQLAAFPSPRQISDRWDVSIATAWRWRRELAAAHGIVPPRIAPGQGRAVTPRAQLMAHGRAGTP